MSTELLDISMASCLILRQHLNAKNLATTRALCALTLYVGQDVCHKVILKLRGPILRTECCSPLAFEYCANSRNAAANRTPNLNSQGESSFPSHFPHTSLQCWSLTHLVMHLKDRCALAQPLLKKCAGPERGTEGFACHQLMKDSVCSTSEGKRHSA